MPSRTKSCAICRKRRIKCDATLPQCLMCMRSGRECPGIPEGPLIVDMTKTARYGMKRRKNNAPKESKEMSTWIRTTFSNINVHRIPQRAMVTEAFYERFLTYFTSEGEGKDIQNRLTWLHRLPVMSTDGTNDALILALQATASAYCAMDSTNVALIQHACNIYGDALQAHSRFIARTKNRHEVTIHMVSTSVLFSFFEAMQATSANAYRSHIYGAAKMLELTGPGQCTQGVLCQIFYHLRTQMAFVHMTGIGQEAPIEVRKILYGTLEYTRLPMFQRLMSHVATLAEVYVALKDNEGHVAQTLDLGTYTMVKGEIETLWQEYAEEAKRKSGRLKWEEAYTGLVRYRDAFTALTVSYFDTARILLAIVATQLADPVVDPENYFTEILEAAQYLQIHNIGCAYMRMATPLLLVALHAPTAWQRNQAIDYFDRWKGGSMSGISSLALKTIRQQQTMPIKQTSRSPLRASPRV